MAIEMIKRCDYCGKVEPMEQQTKTKDVQAREIDINVVFEEKVIASLRSHIGDACEKCKEDILQGSYFSYSVTKAGMKE